MSIHRSWRRATSRRSLRCPNSTTTLTRRSTPTRRFVTLQCKNQTKSYPQLGRNELNQHQSTFNQTLQIIVVLHSEPLIWLDHVSWIFLHRPNVISVLWHQLSREIVWRIYVLEHRVKLNVGKIFESRLPWFIEIWNELNPRSVPHLDLWFLSISFDLKSERGSPSHKLWWMFHHKSLTKFVKYLFRPS